MNNEYFFFFLIIFIYTSVGVFFTLNRTTLYNILHIVSGKKVVTFDLEFLLFKTTTLVFSIFNIMNLL